MSIEYRILWLDDKISDFIDDEFITEIENYILEEGFEPKVIPVETHEKFFIELDKSFDLILTDYHMPGMNGEEIVRAIRDSNSIQTEILFYTAKHDLKDAQKIDRISFLETQGTEGHEEAVVKKLKALIDLTIIKFQDIVAMRGMIMHETSMLDEQKINILNSYIKCTKPEIVDELKQDILKKINSHFGEKLKKVNGAWKTKPDGFEKLMNDTFVFSSVYKIQTLAKVLNDVELDDFSNQYKKDIIQTRNIFAHATLEIEKNEDGKIVNKYFKNKNDDIVFDSKYCKKIRNDIRQHKTNLDNVSKKLDEQ